MEVDLTFRYTQEEYVKAERKYLFASKTITKTSVVLLAIYLPFSLAYFVLTSYSAFGMLFLGVALLALIFGCVLYFYLPGYKFRKTAKYHGEYRMAFSQEGIHFQTPTIDSQLKWDVYKGLWESGDYYYLLQTPRTYSLIPKRAFADADAMQVFEELALAGMQCDKRVL